MSVPNATRLLYMLLAGLVLVQSPGLGATGSNVAYSKMRWDGKPVHVVWVNLNCPDLKVTAAVAENGTGSSESFSSMIGRTKPTAAITGTFFCTKSLMPTGDIIIDGKLIHRGSVGTAVCVGAGNRVEFVPLKNLRTSGMSDYETVVGAGPTLVRNGSVALCPKSEGFSDPEIYRKKKRAAIGVTRNNKLLLVTVNAPVYLRTVAKIMLRLGAVDAVDLDGGASSALYFRGSFLSTPRRKLTNVLVAYDSLASYLQHRSSLAPGLDASAATCSESRPSLELTSSPLTLGTSAGIMDAPLSWMGKRSWNEHGLLRPEQDDAACLAADTPRQAGYHTGAP